MMTLTDLENVANELPTAQRTELLLFLAESLRKEQAQLPESREFSQEQLQAWMDEDEEAMRRFRDRARMFSSTPMACWQPADVPLGRRGLFLIWPRNTAGR